MRVPRRRAWRIGLLAALLFVGATGAILQAQTIVGPDQMDQCDRATFTATITNQSATRSACLLLITRSYTESGVVYVPGTTTLTLHDASEYTVDPVSDTWDIDAIHGSAYVLPPGESISVSYDLETTCDAVSGTEQITVDFEDCANPGTTLQNVSSTSIEILPGAIVVSKTPSVQNASVGDLVTWTITIESTGLGRVQDIEITDVLGPGLAYNSSTGGGSNAGQTTTWSAGSLEVGEAISVDLTAEVIACAGLYNDVDATFGCGPADVCFDTAVDDGTATASLNLIVENPSLSFVAPNVVVPYCSAGTGVTIPIANSGAGTARSIELCCSLQLLAVTNVQGGATYSDGCFSIPDIPGGSAFNLEFDVVYAGDWCTGGPSGTNIFELTYSNDCGIPFIARPQFSTCSSEAGPSLAATKTGPDSLRLGEIGSYDIAVEYVGSADCGGGIPGPVMIVDTYPEGFTVVDPAGGTIDGGARTITWTYDPNTDPPFAETVQIQAPSDCGYCATPAGGTDDNTVTASGTDCCGCTISGNAAAATTILCEGFGDDVAYFSSTMELDRTTTVRCSEDYAVTVTHTYTFIDDLALDDFLLNEFVYFVDGNGDLQYLGDSALVTGATLGAVSDSTPAGRLELPLTDATTVRGKTIVYTYTLIALGLDDPSCQASNYPINAGIDLIGDPTTIGLCGTMYADPDQRLSVTAQPPAMSVAIEGIPVIQEYCATYDVTITLTRASALAKPYDVRLVLTNNGGSILDMSQAVCGGTVSPTDGTTCTAPIEGATTYEWRFADVFDNDADVAAITFPVTVPCGGPLADLSVVATFDDLCDDDGVYDDECSTSASDEASLSLSANVFTRKSPEILYATNRYVAWSVVLHNTGNGTAHNVWLDDALGSGLVYDSASSSIDNPTGATEYANLDHNGGALNGVSWVIDEMQPGELRTITVAAELVACSGLTNHIAASWGCGGSNCQAPRTDDSAVVVPPSNVVATSFSPTPVSMCSDNLATVTIKNAGVTTVYSVTAVVTLPSGLVYLGNPQVQVNSGAWTPTGEPTVVGQTLTWTQTETPELAEADSKEVIRIRFDYTVLCGFTGGNLSFQAGYENPCGTLKTTNVGRFALGLTPAAVTVALRQVSPAPGEAIDCGGQATWEIDVKNAGSTATPVVEVDAVLGDGLIYVSSQGDPTYGPSDGGVNTLQDVHWELMNLPIGATATLQVTGATVGGGLDCEALDIDVDAAWGCGAVDGLSTTFDASCTTTSPATGTLSAIRRPPLDLAASLSPDSIEACADTTELTLTITNNGTVATTSNIDFVITLPDELSYVPGSSEIDCGEGYAGAGDPNPDGQALTWYDAAHPEGIGDDACTSIPPGGTIRLRFDVDVSCYFTTQDIPIVVHYYDCCGITQYDVSTSVTLTSLLPVLSVDKTPTNTDLDLDCYDAGDTVTWTVTITNDGTGVADWVRLADTLGSSLVVDSFTDLVDETPTTVAVGSQVGQTITWEADVALGPGESLSATVTAHAVQPSDDCSRSLRRNTAVATWGCGTLAAPTCEYGTAAQDQSTVRVPNLDIDSADITPIFDCAGDGITPGSGQLQITVRNRGNGDAPITEDFTISVSEPTAGFSVTDTFTALGGILRLNDDSPQTLTLDGWNVSCGNCSYAVTVTLDTGDTVCECQENDNAATLNGTITLPDLVVDSADLAVTCAADGQIRIQGPVTLRNDGCGDPLTGDVSVRFRLFDGADCSSNEIDTFTVDFTGLSVASGGGTQERTIDVTRTLDLCNTCEISIRIEADEDDAVCECDGTNNDLCTGTFPIAFPDLTVTDIDFSQVTCASDTIAGVVRVTVENTGCGASGPFDLRLETDGCLTFTDETVADLGSGASTTVDFAISGTWADCATCACTFTATVDPEGAVCECGGTNNDLSEPYTSTLPDLEISGVIGSIGCATDGQATVDADVTVENTGCGDAAADFDVAVAVYDGADCSGNIIDSWTETIGGETITAGGSTVISLTRRVLSESLCAGDCDYSAHFVVDSGDDICECGGTDNEFCLSSIPSEIPDIVVTEVDPVVDCQAGTASVTATVGNVGCGDATGVVFRLTSSGCAPTTDSAPIDLAVGASQDVVFNYTPDCDGWNCTFTVTADPDAAVCECDGNNALTLDPYPGIGSIGDRVWFDTDAEGDQDPGELGIANVTVILEADLDGDGIIDYRAETTTDADGLYLFDELPAGDYTITVDETTLPDGMGQTYDYDGLGTPHTSGYALAENEHNREQDFGYRGLGSIGDYVWFDANADGVQDPTEEGIEGVTLTLVGDLNGDGIDEILTTTTDADGLYLFDFLPAGPYTITVDNTTLPAGLTQTYDYDGLGTPHTSDYTLGAGERNREQDFGYATPALSVDKVITDIVRRGTSLGASGPVEPGDLIVYRFVIESVGPVPAYNVGFDDTLPPGVEVDTATHAGTYVVSAPADSGSLGLTDGATSFTASIAATVNAGETLTAEFIAVVTSDVEQGVDLTNIAHAYGEGEDGTPIAPENVLLGDTSDTDAEDPDADDTGIATVGVLQPALSVDKTITDIQRADASIGIGGPVEPGDVVYYRFVIRNIGGGTAYGVEFTDTLPTGLVIETDAPGSAGAYTVTAPAASGTLALADGVGAFTTSIDAMILAGEALAADFVAVVTSDIVQGVDLVNTAEATGRDGFGTEIPDESVIIGDVADDDEEDPDADDTGIAVVATREPALSVDKVIFDILRNGSSIGTSGPVEPGDVIFYRYTIRNVGLGTAYAVEFADALPTGLVTETDPPGIAGVYDVTDPAVNDAPLLGLTDGVDAFTTSISATIAGSERLIAHYSVVVTSDVRQGVDLVNVAATTGVDGAGNPIPGENDDLGDTSDDDAEDPDADDTGITLIAPVVPALSVDKRVVDVLRGGTSLGVVDPVLYGDIVVYQYTITNVGLGSAYAVEFADTLPTGLVVETDAPSGSGSYTVSGPAASGSLNLTDGVGSFTTSIGATIAGGEALTAIYMALVTPDAPPALDLVNTAEASGEDGAGTEIPDENAGIGDTSDTDEEDPDADDIGIASVRVGAPALVTRKAVASIRRQGLLVDGDVVEPGDVVTYDVGVANVGDGPAYRVDLFDELPSGFQYAGTTDASWPNGSSMADPLGAPGPLLTWLFDATLESSEELVLRFDALVTSDIMQAATYKNTVTAVGEDGAGEEIPPDNRDVVPDDDDPDDTSDVSLIGAVPALVTDKSIRDIRRGGRSLGTVDTIESGDIVTYALRITNVGLGMAYDVDVRDFLPNPFEYIAGSTRGDWPFRVGTYSDDPSGAPGLTLLWDTSATLDHGEAIVLAFDARIAGTVVVGHQYTNELYAAGRDGAEEEIPANNADDVPEDDDPDDRDSVTVTAVVQVPALVTSKRVTDVFRDGASTPDRTIEEGDTVRFELTVRNVGPATAYRVGIDDRLPFEFDYVVGSTRAAWPRGSTSNDPLPTAEGWIWNVGATLGTGDLLILSFDAVVVGPLFDGNTYTNRMHTFGEDASGGSIPEDQRDIVPGDIDPDDASDVNLIARSSFIEGEGGLLAVPILRKRAEVLGDAVCEGWTATAERLWFQTDIAMFAASELELLGGVPADWALLSETLLPTWLRTVQGEGEIYARDNLVQADVLSSIGVSLSFGPRIERLAEALGTGSEAALALHLGALADRVGLDPNERPSDERWVFLEFAGGEPRYASWHDEALGPSGDWTIVDERIVGSALGMGLLKQAIAAESLLSSVRALDQYLGWVLVEVMANKVLAIDGSLTVRTNGEAAYVPHVHHIENGARFVVGDADSHLFDQLSLLWGLARLVGFLDGSPIAWIGEEADLRTALRETAIRLIGEVLGAIDARHIAPSEAILEVSSAGGEPASTENLGLLLVALDEARRAVPEEAPRIGALLDRALEQLLARQTADGLFRTGDSAEADYVELGAQFAGVRGLLIGQQNTGRSAYAAQAHTAFDALDERLWEDRGGIGLYASSRFDDARTYCYTPLEVGLAVGALRELAAVSSSERRGLVLDRLSGFVRSIVDEAALQLSNALPVGANVVVGSGRGEITALVLDEPNGRLAPVLQQRLCLEDAASDRPCPGRHVLPSEPWYQTDISMYAAYTVQDRVPEFEDYADANLVAVVFHSGLGVPFDETSSARPAVGDPAGGTGDRVALPYASGSPRLTKGIPLSWETATFDTRILASSLGMTLLREGQEVRQFLDESPTDASRGQEAKLLVASILEKLSALAELRVDGPTDDAYVPHAARWDESTGRLVIVENDSLLFDQASLVWGLSEATALLADPRSASLIDARSFGAADPAAMAADLLASALSTLERAHSDASTQILIDSVRPSDAGWILGSTISTVNLGLAASALEHAIDVFGGTSEIGERALSLLARIAEFVQTEAWHGVGEYAEALDLESDADGASCEPETLVAQLGALRVLLAAEKHLGFASAIVGDALRAIDARFWDPALLVYRSRVEQVEWCVTPLDLGMAVDAIDRAADFLGSEDAVAIRTRLMRHVDRILDAAQMQLPSSRGGGERFAPVFDRSVCLRPIELVGEANRARPGDIVRYTVNAENSTDETFIDLLLADTLPEGVTLIGAEPAGEVSGGVVSWTFDRLPPSEDRTWQLLVRADEDIPLGDDLVNCATLTYANLEGEPQPPREACAETKIRTLDDGREDLLSGLPIWYVTDEAMHLASVLDDFSCLEASAWNRAVTAHEMAAANLGVLLGDSALGVPLEHAPRIPTSRSRGNALANLLDAFARQAGLPRAPESVAPIFLPFEAGMPVLRSESGFIDKGVLITPAALGWTLVEEVAFLDACGSDGSSLGTYLRTLTAFTVDNQIEWLSQRLLTSENVYLPCAIRFTPAGDDAAYSVSDPCSSAYDQASLLLGLLRVSGAGTLDRRTKLLAQQMGAAVLDQLLLHWDDESRVLIDALHGEVESGPAGWADMAVVARALAASREVLLRRQSAADRLLEALSQTALNRGGIAQPADEAARLTVLLIASRSLDDTAARSAFLDGWQIYSRTQYGNEGFERRPRSDWTYTPAELAIRLTLLSEIARSAPEHRTQALRAATEHVDRDVLAARVQLTGAARTWIDHTRAACFGLAPVFAHVRGPLVAIE